MSDNREVIKNWIETEDEKIYEQENIKRSKCTCMEESIPLFYVKFGDNPSSYSPKNYDISCPKLSPDGLPTGQGVITRCKTWVWPKFSGFTSWPETERRAKLHSIEGGWESGVLSGNQAFLYCNGVTFRAVFECGVAQGLVVGSFKENVVWIGRYNHGILVGKACAIEPDGGGILTGEVTDGEMTGPDLTFLYPDMETGLRGSWDAGVMVSARQVVINYVWIEDNQIEISCSALFGPEFSFSPSGIDHFGSSDPMMKDPYESKYISVEKSKMEGGGEGVYAKTDLTTNTTAAIFNGFKVPQSGGHNLTEGIEEEEKIYERLSYNIHMPEEEDFFLDLPPAMADLNVYSGSKGHKVNHSFIPNSKFGTIYHPRWGRVRTVETMEEVKEGQELLVDYGYDLLRCPEWYRDLWTRELGGEGKNYWDYKKKGKQ